MADVHVTDPVTTIDESMLVARAKRDPEAFAALYITYFERVHAYCYRRLGHPEEAADATSVIFSRAIESIATCREHSFRSWLFAIAHNALADLHKGRRHEHPIDAIPDLRDRGPTPEDEAIASESFRSVAALMFRLPDDQRHVLELRLAGLSSKEIGAVLGKQSNAVDQAQYRAVQRLRALTGAADTMREGLR